MAEIVVQQTWEHGDEVAYSVFAPSADGYRNEVATVARDRRSIRGPLAVTVNWWSGGSHSSVADAETHLAGMTKAIELAKALEAGAESLTRHGVEKLPEVTR